MKKSSFKYFWQANEDKFPKVSEEDARKLWEAILKHREQHPGKRPPKPKSGLMRFGNPV